MPESRKGQTAREFRFGNSAHAARDCKPDEQLIGVSPLLAIIVIRFDGILIGGRRLIEMFQFSRTNLDETKASHERVKFVVKTFNFVVHFLISNVLRFSPVQP